MNTAKHTPEPWPADMRGIVFANGALACGYVAPNSKPHHNSSRAVACVNACAGINPEAVPDLLAALKALCDAATLGECVKDSEGRECSALIEARAAIAKAEGRAK